MDKAIHRNILFPNTVSIVKSKTLSFIEPKVEGRHWLFAKYSKWKWKVLMKSKWFWFNWSIYCSYHYNVMYMQIIILPRWYMASCIFSSTKKTVNSVECPDILQYVLHRNILWYNRVKYREMYCIVRFANTHPL